MLAYKGFHPGLVCLGYQFTFGLNVTDKANCRANGFHCAANPLDCLSYYSSMEHSEYCLVDAGGDMDEDGEDSKIACTHLTILKKLTRKDFFLHALAYMVDHPELEWNSRVKREVGEASSGFAVVRGIDPVVCGKKGDILALAQEAPHTGRIIRIGLTEVDGSRILPGRWYNVELKEKR